MDGLLLKDLIAEAKGNVTIGRENGCGSNKEVQWEGGDVENII